MLTLKHKVIQRKPRRHFYWGVRDALRDFELVRRQAEDFAAEVGAENVVSIIEHALPRFAVVVWYRERSEAKLPLVDEFFEPSLAR
jgi:hypothetical protein